MGKKKKKLGEKKNVFYYNKKAVTEKKNVTFFLRVRLISPSALPCPCHISPHLLPSLCPSLQPALSLSKPLLKPPTSPACHCHPVSPPSLPSITKPSFLHPRPPPSGGGRWISPVLPPPLPTTAAGQASAEPHGGRQRNRPPIPSGGWVLVAGALLPRGLLLWWQRTLRGRRGSPQQHNVRCQQHRRQQDYPSAWQQG